MSRKLLSCGFGMGVLFVAAAGCDRLEVTVFRVERGTVESTVTSVEAGVIEPLHKARLAVPASGRIMSVNCKEGDRPDAGAVLVEVENELEKLQRDEALSELKRLRELPNEESKERLERAEFSHRRAEVRYEQTLIRAPFSGLVAEVNARVGEMTYGSFPMAFGSAPNPEPLVYLVDDSQLFVEAQIDEADSSAVRLMQPARVTLEGQRGRVLKGRVAFVSPVVSTEEDETRCAEVKVEIFPPCDVGDRDLSGSALVDGGAPAGIIRATATASTGGELPPQNGGSRGSSALPPGVLVGMSADLEILVDQKEDVVRVPTMVILEHGEEKYVYVVLGEVLQRRVVVTGAGNWEWTEVREGLSPGDLVVLPTESKLLRDGRRVKVALERKG